MKKINPFLFTLLVSLMIGGFARAQKENTSTYNPLPNGWPEIKKGVNGLSPRFVPPKSAKINIDKRSVAGLFILKFTEGTHIRFKNDELFFDEINQVNNPEEIARLARAGLKGNDVVNQLQSLKQILAKAKATLGFTIGYMFRTAKEPYQKDDWFMEKTELEQRAGEELADMDLYYLMYAKDLKDAVAEENLLNELNRFGIVEQVYPAVLSEGAFINGENHSLQTTTPITPDITTGQGYINPAPIGLDARYAWTRAGGRGDNIKVIDVEYDWITDHEDFPANYFWGGKPLLCPYVATGTEHGTAVMGILASPHNGFGVSGFVPNIRYGLSTACRPGDYVAGALVATFSGENWLGRCHNVAVANAILHARLALTPGDVMLIEQHTPGPSTGMTCSNGNCSQWEYVPMEYYQECFDMIRLATASGIIVVEAGGNGGQDLDGPVYGNRFNPRVRNSQAILVGASGAGDRMTAGFSNSSARMDLHAWGGNVVTIGYSDGATEPYNYREEQRKYSWNFGGTSSASPMIAGSAASIQGVRVASGQLRMSALEMRNLLVGTGTPLISGRPVGPHPNLRSAIERSTGASGFSGPGVYTLRSKSSRKVMDLDISFFRGGFDGQNLIQWDAHSGLNQQFRIEDAGAGFFRFIALHSGKALDVWGDSRANGAEIKQYSLTGGGNQQFSIVAVGSFYKITGRNSGKVIEVPSSSTTSGSQLKQNTDNGSDNQLWELIRLR